MPDALALPLRFDNRFVRSLPADPSTDSRPRQVFGAAYSWVQPTPVAAPRLLAWSADAASLLGLAAQPDAEAVAAAFSGNHLLPGMQPYATRYGGHQFGNWADQLGDGRAIMLGEALGADGAHWEIQLKGAGPTPYSRWADGRAVLRSSLREYLCSEAMHALGVPTTRALCLVGSGEGVERDMFYDGHPGIEPGAIVTRLAPSFLRFGHFEILAAHGEYALLRQLLDYTVKSHFPELGPPGPQAYLAWFSQVCQRTAHLMAHWMRVGFVHGVMNTDNLSILGLTIDYGPYGWLDHFDAGFTPNTTDRGGRYSYAAQPHVAAWNLARLAQALMPVINDAQALEACLDQYGEDFACAQAAMLRNKLGLAPDTPQAPVFTLANTLYEALALGEVDMTIFFRALSQAQQAPDTHAALTTLTPACYSALTPGAEQALRQWLDDWRALITADARTPEARSAQMNAANPWIIPRNWLAQQAIDAASQGDMGVLQRLMQALRSPYTEQAACADLAQRRPDWARSAPGCGALSCSS